ncbi:pyruvate dehydrogenase E2 component (dihydrolipoamide acetyltransferase) [Thermocatellispora tengchongensis]|uniref:Dihydrolipoamide acetyltransferase component of pyruvate dehydrogenase complex n=1 Tax=Thermocatellispora tengchongensis TaxID=1073253 RepID=A0A840PC96_9ACTN|nr:dihydrolipoamide acetyltransferase family protein [Thermocatellispora tengchongensis]MBB5137258.1 pyruvate dehydrogenase E2 component (dihydrolipoamide acetyltransferase) [Thermocatellispora tengchongensis]
MAAVIRMPEVLTGMGEATLLAWHVAPGDEVSAGQPIAEVETDKAAVDFEADRAGVVAGLLVGDGEQVAVGTPILVLADPGQSAEAALAEARGAAADPEDRDEPAVPETAVTAERPGRRFATPLVRKLARERGIDLATVTGTGPGGRVVRRDLDRHVRPAEPAGVTAPAPGHDAQPAGTERAGTERAVAAMPAAPAAPAAPVPPAPAAPTLPAPAAPAPPAPGALSAPAAGYTDIPHSGMRRAIARRLTESKNTVPHFYLVADCRVDALLELRRTIKEDAATSVTPSVNDFVVKAAAAAFQEVPEANVIWTPDAIRRFGPVSIAVAVALDDGLVTPVIHDVDRRSLTDVSRTAADLVARARAGRLKQAELEGGSFTVSNLGMYGIERFAAIINPPHSGILAVGAASRRPVVGDDGAVGAATVMTVTLSVDHRALDGALGARWLRAFQKIIENPMRILL